MNLAAIGIILLIALQAGNNAVFDRLFPVVKVVNLPPDSMRAEAKWLNSLKTQSLRLGIAAVPANGPSSSCLRVDVASCHVVIVIGLSDIRKSRIPGMANLCVRSKSYASSDFMWAKYIVLFVRTRARASTPLHYGGIYETNCVMLTNSSSWRHHYLRILLKTQGDYKLAHRNYLYLIEIKAINRNISPDARRADR